MFQHWQQSGPLGFGGGAVGGVQQADLQKALSASYATSPASTGPGDMRPLQTEDIEYALRVAEFRSEHIRFWPMIAKKKAWDLREQFDVLTSYGQQLPYGGFMRSGGLPVSFDSTYERRSQDVKFVGTTRGIELPALFVRNAHGNTMTQQRYEAAMHVLAMVEDSLYYARSALDPLQWNGILAQIEAGAADNVVDMQGRPMIEDALQDGVGKIADYGQWGRATHFHHAVRVGQDLSKTFFPKARYDVTEANEIVLGRKLKGFESEYGMVEFVPNSFIGRHHGATVTGPEAAAFGEFSKRPGNPVVSVAPAAAPAGGSKFITGDAGNYFYWAQAINADGQSAAVQLNVGALAVAVGDGVTTTLLPGIGQPPPSFWRIYRTAAGGAANTAQFVFDVPYSAGGTVVTDLNEWRPFCTTGFLLQQNLEAMSFKQLAPFLSHPIGQFDTTYRFAYLMMGTPEVYLPRKCIVYKNIGRSPGSVA